MVARCRWLRWRTATTSAREKDSRHSISSVGLPGRPVGTRCTPNRQMSRRATSGGKSVTRGRRRYSSSAGHHPGRRRQGTWSIPPSLAAGSLTLTAGPVGVISGGNLTGQKSSIRRRTQSARQRRQRGVVAAPGRHDPVQRHEARAVGGLSPQLGRCLWADAARFLPSHSRRRPAEGAAQLQHYVEVRRPLPHRWSQVISAPPHCCRTG